jgi:uncharacterized protein
MKHAMTAILCAAAMTMAAVSPIPADEASHRAAVEELLTLMKMQESMSKSIDEMVKMQSQSNPESSAMYQVTHDFYKKYISWDALKDDVTKIYMNAYSEGEVKELIAFHKSPIGQKMTETNPGLALKIMELTMTQMRDHMQELQKAIMDTMSTEASPPATTAKPASAAKPDAP